MSDPIASQPPTEPISLLQQQAGAILALAGDRWVPQTCATDEDAIAAAGSRATSGVALRDRSHWTCLRFTGEECLEFLHGQTTNDMKSLQPGRGCDTCVVTSTARAIELTTALATEHDLLMLASPQRRQTLQNWFGRLIRFSRAEMTDISDTVAVFELLGADSDRLVSTLAGGDLIGQPYASHLEAELPDSKMSDSASPDSKIKVQWVVGTSLAVPGYLAICDRAAAAPLWQRLQALQAIPMGEAAWERLRVQQGRPMPDSELTEDFNPLEAGLWNAVSLDKGCYIGQETLARLHTYDGVKQQLWGLKLSDRVEPGSPLSVEGNRAGLVTSTRDDIPFALAYVRRQYAEAGRSVRVGESTEAELVELPYPQRSPV